MVHAYIALGSNISPRAQYLYQAIDRIEEHEGIHVLQRSSIYETVPVGYTEQSDFLNMVIHVKTNLSAQELLSYCQSIEQTLGRERLVKWGPRTIDLDILLYNQENIESEQLMVPHPRLQERAFVLVPLYEIDQELHVPHMQQSVKQLLSALADEEIEGVKPWKPKNGESESKHTEN